MGSAAAVEAIPSQGSEPTIEIKIKTLDSQTYTLKVDKQMPVPALKEQIASVTGVLSEQQRLICRGRVLKDDQLLSAYHVEDGHTLHMVVRQPVASSSEGMHDQQADPASFSSWSRSFAAADPSATITSWGPSVVIESLSMPDQGDGGVPPEISRIVSAVLGSFGMSSLGSAIDGADVTRDLGLGRTSSASATFEINQQAGARVQSDGSHSAFGIPAVGSLGSSLHPPVIPDALTTLSQYLSHIRREFNRIGTSGENNSQTDNISRSEQGDLNSSSSESGSVEGRLPTPASLAEVILSSRELLTEQVSESLLQLGRQLSTQESMTDSSARSRTQTTAWRTGVQLHNLGAFLLELGRTTMTLRLGQAPSEAVVNTGPAVFINSTSPNPLMVQPLPFQPGGATLGAGFPMGSVQPGSGFVPRRIDIQIRRGGSSTTSSTVTNEERGESGQRNPAAGGSADNTANQTTTREESLAGESGVRVVPIRTMVATAAATVPGSFGHPFVGRFQQVGSEQRSHAQTQQQAVPQTAQNDENAEVRVREPSTTTRSININILSAAGGARTGQESDRQVPGSVMQFLRSLFPTGEIHVEAAGSDSGTTTTTPPPAPQNVGSATAAAEEGSESRPSEEGLFLSNLLRQILPVVSEHSGSEPGDASQGEAQRSQDSYSQVENNGVGTSRRSNDSHPSSPNSKRQRRE
ncbi:unnamed protein product [Linum tenue]|uniref:Ubiquitin-like domain-containing protein n=1 Tax=Linum tenue TaxID=586396 RepID=A0AAV0HX96_9ROSI|nr:unnamed protein product [Linum tenue]